MWKVLIADDEPKIRRGLKGSIEWGELDMEIAGEAEDGEIALELAKSTNPDILLVDICMPFLNGLEFVEQLYDFLPGAIVIVITGHDEFAYAQQAIKLRAFDYLLKPVSKNQLYLVLRKVKEELEQVKSANKYMDWANQQLKKNLPVLKERFFNEWIGGRLTQFEIDEQLRFLKLSINKNSGMLLIKVTEKFSSGEASKEWDRQLLLFAVQNITEELLQDFSPNVVFRDNKDNIIAISATNNEEEWNEIGVKLTKAVGLYLKQVIIVCQKDIKGKLLDIPNDYQELIKAVTRESTFTPIVQLTKNYIDLNYHREELSLDDVADEVKISSSYLSRLLRQELGYSFVEYLTNVRIKKAIQLLNDPILKMYEVAERVGYNNQHYFSTAFKKVLGISPVEYRKGGQGNC